MVRQFMTLLLLVLPVFPCHAGTTTNIATEEKEHIPANSSWSQVAVRNITRAHEIIREAHPGVLDPTDQGFQQWFVKGYDEALELARQADSESKALAALRFYVTGYRDGHLVAWTEEAVNESPRWAGWLVRRSNGRYRVAVRAPDWPAEIPRLGDELLSCDGQPIDDLLAKKVAPFVDRRLSLAETRSRLALHLTSEPSYETLWEPLRLKQCEVRSSSGEVHRFVLQWQPYTDQQQRMAIQAVPRQGIKQLRQGIYWIHATDFSLSSRKAFISFERLLEKVRGLEDADAVVLDTRGNGGGNSLFGYRLLAALFKEALSDDAETSEASAKAYWRVSATARNSLETVKARIGKQEGQKSLSYKFADTLLSRMNEAASRGLAFVEQMDVSDDELAEPGRPFAGKLVLVTDSGCASACLDFVGSVLDIPEAVHVGSVTSGDTPYLDITPLPLSDTVKMWVPLKVWKNRKRGNNEPYVPQFSFEGDLSDTAAVQAWVLDSILPTARKISIP
ncbi:S41 family peptidase [Pseudomonas sp. GCM10022186]|uniref:S41 family peptidase n=1 Tax=Pseudomonas sp. GCM10022186 TaxID=3252650 RepID=UPI0036239074